ncbi:hypothetical protein ACEZ3G_11095 [Maribacter algicola]|uniref:Uncharacterized protein n=1 Tax=Meishania litoralis TaxID=3434685 RepID=A0ACC7LLA8_9FLAO
MRRLHFLFKVVLFVLLVPIHTNGNTLGYNEAFNTNETIAKTEITITYPKNGTEWEAPGLVKLEWTTKNIPANKTIMFYLSKDDMVIQELGIFKNSGYAESIKLEHYLQPSANYRVFGIELFPDDKNNVAKNATPLFTITKKQRQPKPIASEESKTPPTVRETFDGRKLNYVEEMEVHSPNIHINLWDHSRKDGDIVSIYLNGEAIVSKYTLQYHKKKVAISLDPSKPNDLFLYAHNLGKFPPNTVSIEIVDGNNAENVVLNSDLKSCEAVLINVK